MDASAALDRDGLFEDDDEDFGLQQPQSMLDTSQLAQLSSCILLERFLRAVIQLSNGSILLQTLLQRKRVQALRTI